MCDRTRRWGLWVREEKLPFPAFGGFNNYLEERKKKKKDFFFGTSAQQAAPLLWPDAALSAIVKY